MSAKKRRRFWTPANVLTLKRMRRDGAFAIAQTLRRSPAAVRYKAHKQGISLRMAA